MHFCYKNQAIKAAWLFRTDQYAPNQLASLTPHDLGILFWNCALNGTDAKEYANTLECLQFWKDVTYSWFDLQWNTELGVVTEENVLNQMLWFNSHIKIANWVCYYSKVARQGMIYLSDILTDMYEFKTHVTICEQYGNINWFEYHQLCHAIPKEWLTMVKSATKTKSLTDTVLLQKK